MAAALAAALVIAHRIEVFNSHVFLRTFANQNKLQE